MKNYDIIIVGGGIAGTGLAHNLSQECPNKSVLVIDKKGLGANAGYGIRTAFEETIKKYKLPYFHKYNTWKVGAYDEVYITLRNKVYLLNYEDVCADKLKHSNTELKIEEAISTNNSVLITNKRKYRFRYLIDCSGSDFFLRKLFNKPFPFMYWLADSKLLERNFDLNEIGISDKSCYVFFSDTDFVEDFYPLKNRVLEGEWSYSREYGSFNIKSHDRTIIKKIPNPKIIKRDYTSVPVSPVLPLIFKNYAYLGDSFGNANPHVGMGIDIISDSSFLLAKAIKKNNLLLFEKEWKKKYLNNFIKCLASKFDRYHNSEFIEKVKNYPKLSEVIKKFSECPHFFQSLMKNEINVKIPREIKNIFPKRMLIFQLLYNINLRMRYFKMRFM